MSLKVYFDLMSQPARALIIYLNHCKIPFTEQHTSLRKGEHFTEKYGKINRFQKVPAIDHNGFKLGESIAIIRYLSREFPQGEILYPKDSQSQAKVDEFLEWQHLNVRASAAMYFMIKAIMPKMTGKPADEEVVKEYGAKIEDTIDNLENLFLCKNRKFLAGDVITFADVLAACELEQPLAVGYDIYGKHKVMEDWMKSVQSALQPHYNDAHSIIYKISQKYAEKSKN